MRGVGLLILLFRVRSEVVFKLNSSGLGFSG